MQPAVSRLLGEGFFVADGFHLFSLLLDHALPIDRPMFRDQARSILDAHPDGDQAANDICALLL